MKPMSGLKMTPLLTQNYCRGPPKKKRKTTKASTEESIVPFDGEALASSMTFPPRFSLSQSVYVHLNFHVINSLCFQ